MTQTAKTETCDQRVERAMRSRLDELRAMLNPTADDIELMDDGTLDTVIGYCEREYRYSDTSEYRDEETGELDLDDWWMDDSLQLDIRDAGYEAFNEYGLSFDYVAPDTFSDQPQGYFRYQISWGGPSEEIRYYVNPNLSMYRAEFWFLDWFDGASRTLNGDDLAIARTVWEQFSETGTVEYLIKQERES